MYIKKKNRRIIKKKEEKEEGQVYHYLKPFIRDHNKEDEQSETQSEHMEKQIAIQKGTKRLLPFMIQYKEDLAKKNKKKANLHEDSDSGDETEELDTFSSDYSDEDEEVEESTIKQKENPKKALSARSKLKENRAKSKIFQTLQKLLNTNFETDDNNQKFRAISKRKNSIELFMKNMVEQNHLTKLKDTPLAMRALPDTAANYYVDNHVFDRDESYQNQLNELFLDLPEDIVIPPNTKSSTARARIGDRKTERDIDKKIQLKGKSVDIRETIEEEPKKEEVKPLVLINKYQFVSRKAVKLKGGAVSTLYWLCHLVERQDDLYRVYRYKITKKSPAISKLWKEKLKPLYHPNLLNYTDYFQSTHKNQEYMNVTMENYKELKISSTLGERKILSLAIQLGLAVGYLHSQNGFVHGRIRSRSIFVTNESSHQIVLGRLPLSPPKRFINNTYETINMTQDILDYAKLVFGWFEKCNCLEFVYIYLSDTIKNPQSTTINKLVFQLQHVYQSMSSITNKSMLSYEDTKSSPNYAHSINRHSSQTISPTNLKIQTTSLQVNDHTNVAIAKTNPSPYSPRKEEAPPQNANMLSVSSISNQEAPMQRMKNKMAASPLTAHFLRTNSFNSLVSDASVETFGSPLITPPPFKKPLKGILKKAKRELKEVQPTQPLDATFNINKLKPKRSGYIEARKRLLDEKRKALQAKQANTESKEVKSSKFANILRKSGVIKKSHLSHLMKDNDTESAISVDVNDRSLNNDTNTEYMEENWIPTDVSVNTNTQYIHDRKKDLEENSLYKYSYESTMGSPHAGSTLSFLNDVTSNKTSQKASSHRSSFSSFVGRKELDFTKLEMMNNTRFDPPTTPMSHQEEMFGEDGEPDHYLNFGQAFIFQDIDDIHQPAQFTNFQARRSVKESITDQGSYYQQFIPVGSRQTTPESVKYASSFMAPEETSVHTPTKSENETPFREFHHHSTIENNDTKEEAKKRVKTAQKKKREKKKEADKKRRKRKKKRLTPRVNLPNAPTPPASSPMTFLHQQQALLTKLQYINASDDKVQAVQLPNIHQPGQTLTNSVLQNEEVYSILSTSDTEEDDSSTLFNCFEHVTKSVLSFLFPSVLPGDPVLLLIGSNRFGKQSFCFYLEQLLWSVLPQTCVIPMFISLPEISARTYDLLDEYAKHIQIEDLHMLSNIDMFTFCFIIDGYDEVEETKNLAFTNQLIEQWPNAKVIFTCTQPYLNTLSAANNDIIDPNRPKFAKHFFTENQKVRLCQLTPFLQN